MGFTTHVSQFTLEIRRQIHLAEGNQRSKIGEQDQGPIDGDILVSKAFESTSALH